MILRLTSEPVPLPPSVGVGCVVRPISVQRNRPHDPSFEIGSHTLVLEGGKVLTVAHVCIHIGDKRAARFVKTNNAVVRHNGSLETEEGAVEVLDEIVLVARAEDVPTTAEPAQEILAGRIRSEVALSVAVTAVGVIEVDATHHVEPGRMWSEYKVGPAA